MVQPRIDFPASDEGAIRRETQRIRERQKLEQLAQGIGGPGTRVADPNLFQRFLATTGEQYTRVNQAAQSFLPSNQEIVSYLGEIGQELLRSPIPEGFVTGAPSALQPAARVIRESAAPAAAATLPLGGSARVVGGGLLGAAGGATAGRAIGGDTGELIGAIGGGVVGGVPALQRLAGRGATAAGRGGVRLAEEMGRTNVGNVLLPSAPIRQAAARPGRVTKEIIENIRLSDRLTPDQNAALRLQVRRSLNRTRPQINPGLVRQDILHLRPEFDTRAVEAALAAFGKETDPAIRRAAWGNVLDQLAAVGRPVPIEASGTARGFVGELIPGVPETRGRDFTTLPPDPIRPPLAGEIGELDPRMPQPSARPPRSSAELALEREIAAARLEQDIVRARTRLPQSSAEATLEAEVAAARGQLPQAMPEPVARLTAAIQNVKRLAPALRTELETKRSAELGRRAAMGMQAAEGGPATQAGRAFRSRLGGELPALPQLESVQGQFTPEDVEVLYRRIWRTGILRSFEKGNADEALLKVLGIDGVEIPTPYEMGLLERVFGPELRQAIEQAGKGGLRKAWEQTLDVANLPRAVMSSYDLSAMFRQGAILTVAHPQSAFIGKNSATVRMLRAFGRKEAYDESLSRIRADPDFEVVRALGKTNKLFIADVAETRLVAREEAFMSRLAGRIPGIKGSQRAFNTYLNEMKWKTMKNYLGTLRSEGIDPATQGQRGVETMSRFLNVATGRGKLGSIAERSQLIQEILSVPIWSPRLFFSRIQAPIEGFRALARVRSADPAMRIASRQIGGDLVKYVGGVMGVLSILKLSGLADVQMDPRSSDFGKIRLGATRIDPWAGFQQIVRYTAQFITGRTRVPAGVPGAGGVMPTARDRVLGKFIRSKLSPGGVSVGATFLPEDTPISGLSGGGRTFLGERIVPGTARPRKTIPDRTIGLDEYVRDQVLPLIYQDIEQAIEEQGLVPGMLFGLAPAVGLGVTTFEDDSRR